MEIVTTKDTMATDIALSTMWAIDRFSSLEDFFFHDVQGVTDHLAAGLGQVDWGLVFEHLPASTLRTCEFRPSNTPQEVAAGLKWLADKEKGVES